MIPEGRRLFGRLSVLDNLLLGSYSLTSREEIQETLENVYQLFPILKERKGQRSDTFSGGEQQQLAIARGLMSRPSLLMLDEPSLGLGPKLVSDIFRIIKEINCNGVTVLLVEQNVYEALEISHRAYVLQTGRVVLEGKGEELLKSDLVRQAYLGMCCEKESAINHANRHAIRKRGFRSIFLTDWKLQLFASHASPRGSRKSPPFALLIPEDVNRLQKLQGTTERLHPHLRYHPPCSQRNNSPHSHSRTYTGRIKPQAITVLVATGLHRPNEGEELREVVGSDWVINTVRVVNHFAREDADHEDLGSCRRDIPVKLDRRFLRVRPTHCRRTCGAAFHGWLFRRQEIIAPGIAHEKTIRIFHSARILEHCRATNCVMEGNPLHDIQMDILQKLGPVLPSMRSSTKPGIFLLSISAILNRVMSMLLPLYGLMRKYR